MHPVIVFQHPQFVVLDKPAGFSVQELAEAYRRFFPQFHPVHRLDRDTSGLWLIALDAEANRELSQAFQQQRVSKYYLAVTHGKPKKKQGRIIGDMQRTRRGQWKLLHSRNNPAITGFHSVGLEDGKRLVLCRPLTGKTHQIRVAMKSLGSPIWGDRLYDAAGAGAADRLYLHAYRLAFQWQQQRFSFTLEPADGCYFGGAAFAQALTHLQEVDNNDATDRH